MTIIVAVIATVIVSAGFALAIRRGRGSARFLVLAAAISLVIALGIAWDRTSDPKADRAFALVFLAMTTTVVDITLMAGSRNGRRRRRRG
jgi:hypothetical protein